MTAVLSGAPPRRSFPAGDEPRALPMVTSSLGLIAGKAAAMGLGFLFWLAAARLAAPAEVGLTSGVVSAVLLCTQLGLLGVGFAVIAQYPRHARRPSALLDTAVTTVATTGVVTGALFLLLLATGAFAELGTVTTRPGYVLLFLAMGALGTTGVLFDQVSMAQRRGNQVLVRNIANGVVTIAPLAVAGLAGAHPGSQGLFAAWVGGSLAACVVGLVQFARSPVRYRFRPSLEWRLVRVLVRSGAPNQGLAFVERGPGLVLAVVVTELLGATQNAYWYAAWMTAWLVFVIPASMGVGLFAEVVHQPAVLAQRARRALRASLALGIPLAGIAALLAPLALSLLGPGYADAGAGPLRLLLLGVIPLSFTHVYYGVCRATGRLGEPVATGLTALAAGVAGAAAAAPRAGLAGVALAWVLVQAAAGAWACARLPRLAGRPEPAPERIPGQSLPARRRGRGEPSRAADGSPILLPTAPAQPEEGRTGPGDLGGRPWTGRAALLSAGLIVAALVLWSTGVRRVDLTGLTDLGLVTVLPVPVLLAPALLTVGFCWALRRVPLRPVVLGAHVLALVVVLFGTAAVIEPVPGFRVIWRHAGIVEYVARTGTVDPGIDAYFNWPGFFVLSAFVSSLAGLKSALSLGPWAPVFFNVLYLPPLVVLFRSVTSDARLVWLAVWTFLITNWVGQDYLAPQALGYFALLVLLAVLVRWFGPAAPRPQTPASATPGSTGGRLVLPAPVRRVALMAVVIVVFAALVPSHQLTPFAVLAATTTLVVFRRCPARGLPVLMAVMTATWITFMASTFLAGHLATLVARVGQVGQSASANVGERLQGSPEHVQVVNVRLAFTAVLWALAALGWWRRRRRGHDDAALALLALAPFPLLVLQPYGGEMLLRVYLFALPAVAFFAAAVLTPRRWSSRWGATGAGLALVALLAPFVVTRYGNERISYFTRTEVATARWLYDVAEPGSLLLGASENLPWKAERYEAYRYRTVDDLDFGTTADSVAGSVVAEMKAHRRPGAYFVITRAQRAHVEALGLLPPGALERVEAVLQATPGVRLAYADGDALIFALVPEVPG